MKLIFNYYWGNFFEYPQPLGGFQVEKEKEGLTKKKGRKKQQRRKPNKSVSRLKRK